MQLPLIALLILFSFNTTWNAGNEQRILSSGIRPAQSQKHLVFVAIGLIFNLAYFFVNVALNPFVAFFKVEEQQRHLLIMIPDLLTSFFFLAATVGWLQLLIRRYGTRNNIPHILLRVLNKYTLLILFVGVSAWIFYHNFNAYHRDFSGYVFCAYLLTGLYVLHRFRTARKGSGIYRNFFVLGGFVLWALLQLLNFFDRPAHHYSYIALIGFSGSFVAKAVILFGFYNFYVNTSVVAVQNLEASNSELKRKVEFIQQLQKAVNQLSNSRSIQELAELATQHLTDKLLFVYEYAIFSDLNHLENEIVIRAAFASGADTKMYSSSQIEYPKYIPLDRDHIFVKAYKSKKVVWVQGDLIDGEKDDGTIEIDPVDTLMPGDDDQIKLIRFFLPVFDGKQGDDEKANFRNTRDKKVLAIIEMGMYGETSPSENARMAIYNSGELSIYLDNLAQTYTWLVAKQVKDDVYTNLTEADNITSDNHQKYIEEVLQKLISYLNIDFGCIALLRTNDVENNPYCIAYAGNLAESKVEILTREVRKRHSMVTVTNTDSNLEDLVTQSMAEKIKALSWFTKEIAFYPGRITGQLYLFSNTKDYFSERIVYLIGDMLSSITAVFNEKRFHESVAEAVVPDNALMDADTNIQPVISLLQSYLGSPYVCIWLRDYPAKPAGNFIQKHASPEFKHVSRNFQKKSIAASALDFGKEEAILVCPHNENDELYRMYWDFHDNICFTSLVQKPLKAQYQEFGFVNIYFQGPPVQLSNDDKSFLNLIAAKTIMTLQIHNLVLAFREISSSLIKNNLKATLSNITNKAVELLMADPVILFQSKNGEDVFFKDAIVSKIENFKDPLIEELFMSKQEKHVGLAEQIIAGESKFFSNYKEFNDYISKVEKKYEREKFKKHFGEREEIKSFAAIKLTNKFGNKEAAVGVMFINFRHEVVFSGELRKVIETFAALASTSIMTGMVFERTQRYLISNLKITKPLLGDLAIRGALHDAHKVYNAFQGHFISLIDSIEDPWRGRKLDVRDIFGLLKHMELPLQQLHQQFEKLFSLYKRDESIIIEKHDVVKIIREQLGFLSSELYEKHIDPITSFHQPSIIIDCDGSLIGNALFNLLNNAYYALEPRGKLEVRTFDTKDDRLGIQVIDNGKGVSDEISSTIFAPYVSDKQDGSGLGLTMTKSTIEQHGGNINFSSKNGKTVFTIILPKNINVK